MMKRLGGEREDRHDVGRRIETKRHSLTRVTL